jgi:hypothetical protein
VKVPGKRRVEFLDWKDVDLEEDDYVMKCHPVSALLDDPSARFQQVQEWVQAGWYTIPQAKRLMDFPDTDAVNSLENAMEDRLNEVFDLIVDDGEYTPPEPYFDLKRARELCLEHIVRGESDNLEPERLEMLYIFNTQLDLLEQEAQAAMVQQAQAMAPQPTAPRRSAADAAVRPHSQRELPRSSRLMPDPITSPAQPVAPAATTTATPAGTPPPATTPPAGQC